MTGGIVFKSSIDSSGGKGVLFIDRSDEFTTVKEVLRKKMNYIAQERIIQHKILSEIHSSSINTIRIISFYFHGKVEVLSGILRMGIGKSKVDNSSSGGIFCGITQDGHLKECAYNKWGERYDKHPTSGFVFADTPVPGYDICKEICTSLHYRLVRVSQLISWDLAIDTEGTPILIEVNLTFGDIDFHQIANGPLFGAYTDSVIQMVFSDKINHMLNKVFY